MEKEQKLRMFLRTVFVEVSYNGGRKISLFLGFNRHNWRGNALRLMQSLTYDMVQYIGYRNLVTYCLFTMMSYM
jgi:hypothetical protein